MNNLWGNIFKRRGPVTEEERILEILKQVPLFESLTRRELAAIERILHRRTYQPEELIFRQGEPGMGMYIVERGSVAIVTGAGSNELAQLHAGEFFGELALLDDSPRSASAVAREECKTLGFFQPDLMGLIERNPKLGVKIVLKLASVLGERLRKSNEQMQPKAVVEEEAP